ncbi:MAG: benzoate/H(+) symporter BenE family transporter [Gammaproteobacteria bacterium]|nr:benzoate/H(+) symporter BenE family transporter [Gammaproteobacteria bacterium]
MEKPPKDQPNASQIIKDIGIGYIANGFVGWVFAATAPLAIILSIGSQSGLSDAELSSWIFGVFFINGLITILFCTVYRQPLSFFWTIPGTVLIGPALTHLSYGEVIGAYYATGILIIALGLSGRVKQAMQAIPMPIVMGMVAGVFMRFGQDLLRSLHEDFIIAGPMAVTWILLGAMPKLGRRMPPLIGALLVGIFTILVSGRLDVSVLGPVTLTSPVIQMPEWSWSALAELVVPLAITVLAVQNGQGIAVLQSAGHKPPVNALTIACGVGSLFSAVVGAVSTCLTGPTNAILTSSGEVKRQYTAGIVTGLLAMIFGLFSPTLIELMLNLPQTFIVTIAGLAMLRILQSAFVTCFSGRFSLGALIAFLVTTVDLNLLNIGAAFWGLVAGFSVSWVLERSDFRLAASTS